MLQNSQKHCISSCTYELQDRASEIYKRLEDQKCTRGRNLDALVAACIYIACRQEGKPRTVKGAAEILSGHVAFLLVYFTVYEVDKMSGILLEICSIANGATKKEIGRAKEFIVKQLKVEMGESMEMGTIHAGDYLVGINECYDLKQSHLISLLMEVLNCLGFLCTILLF